MNEIFLGQNLRLIRLFHKLSLQDLADRVGPSKQYLSKIEAGFAAPTDDLVQRLSVVLDVLPAFFYEVDPMPIAEDQCHFRKTMTTSVSTRQEARAYGEMLKRFVSLLDERLQLPEPRFVTGDASTAESIERTAEHSRKLWGLGLGPISNMVRVAENAGAVTLRFEMAPDIDAISIATRRPVIGLNPVGRSSCRARFGLAHELGHFSLHAGISTGDKRTEAEANRFASAFLMPRSTFGKVCARATKGARFDWRAMSAIKREWGVSKAAILYRGRQLGVFSDDVYLRGVIHLKRHGEAIVEVEDPEMPVEQPEVIDAGLQVLSEQVGISVAAIARLLNVRSSIVARLLGQSEFVTTGRALRLVS